MKHLDVVAIYKNGAVVAHLDINHPDILEFVQLPEHELRGLKDASTSMPDSGIKPTIKVKDAILDGIKSGDIWLNKIKYDKMDKESTETCVLRFTCPHEEHACSSMSISQPVIHGISKRLSLKVCPSCAISMAEQVLEGLENTYPRDKTGKSGSECLAWPTSSDDMD